MSPEAWNLRGALLLAPLLVILSIPLFLSEVRRSTRRWPAWLMLALCLKLLGAVARYRLVFDLYGGVADAVGYHGAGTRISAAIWEGNLTLSAIPELASPFGTKFLRIATGVVYTLIGPTMLGGFLVFSWLSFLGMFLFYRAFNLAVPEGRSASYARWIFLMPSMVYWPSSLGKEALMIFALGMAAYGSAHILRGQTPRGLLPLIAGISLAGMIRPHMAAITMIALAAGSLFRKSRSAWGSLAPVAHAVSLAAMVGIALVVVSWAARYLKDFSAIDTSGGTQAILEETSRRTGQGGSEFQAPLAGSPLGVPIAVFTVLFRPFIFEANNLQALAAACEASFLLAVTVRRRRNVLAALRAGFRRPYVVMALAYIAGFGFAFSGIANFGILVRQRAQVLPFFFVLLAFPIWSSRHPSPGPKGGMVEAEATARSARQPLSSVSRRADGAAP